MALEMSLFSTVFSSASTRCVGVCVHARARLATFVFYGSEIYFYLSQMYVLLAIEPGVLPTPGKRTE